MQRASTVLVWLLALHGCSEERHARVVVEAAPGTSLDVVRLEVAARFDPTGGGAAHQQAETLPSGSGGGAVSLPADFVVLLGDGSGELAVSATARDADGASIASGRATGEIHSGGSGRVATLTLVLNAGSNAGCRDGVALRGEICYGPSFAATDGRVGGAAVLDFDDDGVLDLVAGVTLEFDNGERGLSLQKGQGGDRFEAPARIVGPVMGSYETAAVAVGDLDEDGRADVVVGGSNDAPALVSRSGPLGLGSLEALAEETRGLDPRLADFNADGHLDLVSHGNSRIHVFLGDGGGTLPPSGEVTFDDRTTAIDVGEVDSYPGPDVVVASRSFRGLPQRLTILGWQNDQFVVRAGLQDVPTARDVAVADLDGDGLAEIVAIDRSEVRVYYFEADTIVAEPELTVEASPTSNSLNYVESVTAIHRSGQPDDVAVALTGDPDNDPRDVISLVLLRAQEGTRALAELARTNVRCSRGFLSAADVDEDGIEEILVACNERSGFEDEGVVIVHVQGDALEAPQRGPVMELSVDVGDIDRDGRPDLAYTQGSRLLVQIGADEPGLAPVSDAGSVSSSVTRPVVADLDGDGQDEVGVLCPRCSTEDGQILAFSRTGLGWSQDGQAIEGLDPNDGGSSRRPMALTAARLEAGGRLRLVAALVDGAVVAWGEEGLLEAAGALQPAGGEDVRIAAGEIDGEPGEDVAVTWADGLAVVLFRADGSGGLQAGERFADRIGDGEPGPIAVGDLDGDGLAEIIVTRRNGRDVWFYGWRDGAVEALGSFTADVSVYSASALDLDGDGASELVCAGVPKIAIYSLHDGGPVPRLSLPGSRGFYDSLHAWPREQADDAWTPPMLWTTARTEVGDSDWQAYELLWRPSP